ncbi:hypothetical protein [Roseibacillus ishigakijimensis]|uniref:Uncharacterized protein n=1 Tax=Roseibacillus ishigakijimensis TaxID=454146 RepID=A0A934RUZ7_9BACT|nr:hypothetical protein [Roseibacillus ishigakijimensis]MBK1835494.1 hypothetical protein [Roseibacillus ishigakijimensis]
MSTPSVLALRRQLSARFPAAHAGRKEPESHHFQSLPPLPKATLSELVSPPEVTGLGLVLAELLAQSRGEEQTPPLALIDPGDHFDPASYSVHRPLLWLRAPSLKKALQAADLLVRDGNIPLVLLDCSLTPLPEVRQIPPSSWYRLRALAEASGTLLLALTSTPTLPAATTRYQLTSALTLTDMAALRSQWLPKVSFHPLRAHQSQPANMG